MTSPSNAKLTNDVIRDRISKHSGTLLYRAPQEVLDRVMTLGTLNTLKKGQTIFAQGDESKWIYFLVDGAVEIQLHGLKVRTMKKAGEVGGLTSSIPMEEGQVMLRSSTHFVTSETASILVMSHEVYQSLLDHPDFAHNTVRFLQHRVRSKMHVIDLLQRSRADHADGGSSADGADASTAKPRFNIAVFDTKPYDRKYLGETFATANKDFQLNFFDAKLNDSTAPIAAGCQAVCIFVNDVCDARTLITLKTVGVSLVLLRCAGFNNVDLPKAKALGIAVLRVPAYSPNAVAEHAFALLATVNRKTARAYSRVRDGNFTLSGLEGRDLNGLTCGVVGVGKIGKCFANIAKGCGMKVLVWDAYLDQKWVAETGVEVVAKLSDLFPRCDVLSLHVPLTPETTHLVNAQTLAQMPKGAIVINTSRGPIVDAPALLESLVQGHIGGAGLDVYEAEAAYFFEDRSERPIADGVLARLANMPNVVITSHQAFLTDKALTAIAATTLQNARTYVAAGLEAGPLTHKDREAKISALANVVLPPPSKL